VFISSIIDVYSYELVYKQWINDNNNNNNIFNCKWAAAWWQWL
jgi:hypothetical protein